MDLSSAYFIESAWLRTTGGELRWEIVLRSVDTSMKSQPGFSVSMSQSVEFIPGRSSTSA